MSEQQPQIDPEFENLYFQIDKKIGIAANVILKLVAENEARLLKKILIRLDTFLDELENIE